MATVAFVFGPGVIPMWPAWSRAQFAEDTHDIFPEFSTQSAPRLKWWKGLTASLAAYLACSASTLTLIAAGWITFRADKLNKWYWSFAVAALLLLFVPSLFARFVWRKSDDGATNPNPNFWRILRYSLITQLNEVISYFYLLVVAAVIIARFGLDENLSIRGFSRYSRLPNSYLP